MSETDDNIPSGYFRDTDGMLRIKTQASTNTPPDEPLTIPSLDDCAKLSHADLLKLVERMACQCGLVAAMTDEQVYRAGMDRLAHLALTLPKSEARHISTVFDRWADRYKGKPAMTVNQNFTMTLEQLVLQSYKEPMKTIEGDKG